MDILKVENLVKTYKNGNTTINAVDHVSFSVEKEILLLLLEPVVVGNLHSYIYLEVLIDLRVVKYLLIM